MYESFYGTKHSSWINFDIDTSSTRIVEFLANEKKADSYKCEIGEGIYTMAGVLCTPISGQ